MARDPLFGERIVWTASPTELAPPPLARAASFLFFVLAAISLSFAVVIALALQTAPAGPLLFSLWCASLGIAAREVPREFFAPFVGAVQGIRAEYRRIDAQRRKESAEHRSPAAEVRRTRG